MADAPKCPVDHGSLPQPVNSAECPVDHSARSSWTSFFSFNKPSSSKPAPAPEPGPSSLSNSREVSSIPNAKGENWVYPSEAQFFAAMARKNHNPHESDMRTIVPIHNAVNERAWQEILKWEQGKGGEACGGIKLVSFKGRPGDLSPKARWKSILGYTKPFDRHDWLVDRCGVRTRYIIDFYTGRSLGPAQAPSFYLDVRPALDNWEGVKMRIGAALESWFGPTLQTPSSPPRQTRPSS